MRKIVVLILTTQLLIYLTKAESHCFRRVRSAIDSWQNLQMELSEIGEVKPRVPTPYFYTDELRSVRDWLNQTSIGEDELRLLLEIGLALGFSREDVSQGLNNADNFKTLLNEIVGKSISSLVDTVQEGNKRYLNIVSGIPVPVISHLSGLYQ